MKLHIFVEDDKGKARGKRKTKASKPVAKQTDKKKSQRAYWAKRKAMEKRRENAPAGGNDEQTEN